MATFSEYELDALSATALRKLCRESDIKVARKSRADLIHELRVARAGRPAPSPPAEVSKRSAEEAGLDPLDRPVQDGSLKSTATGGRRMTRRRSMQLARATAKTEETEDHALSTTGGVARSQTLDTSLAEPVAEAKAEEAEAPPRRPFSKGKQSRTRVMPDLKAAEAAETDTMNKRDSAYIPVANDSIKKKLEKALKERLFLIDILKRDDDKFHYEFRVLGNSGRVYQVELGRRPRCDCPDFVMRRQICKHVIFVYLRILKLRIDNPVIWQTALSTAELVNEIRPAVELIRDLKAVQADTSVVRYVQQQFGGASASVPVVEKRHADECPICYEPFDGIEEETFCMYSCGNTYHKRCIEQVEKHAGAGMLCPLCQAPFNRVMEAEHVPNLQTRHGKQKSRSARVYDDSYLDVSNLSASHRKAKEEEEARRESRRMQRSGGRRGGSSSQAAGNDNDGDGHDPQHGPAAGFQPGDYEDESGLF